MSILNNTSSLQAILEQVNTLPTGSEQATPFISINSSGLITATAGDKSSSHQLAFQAAKTITPSTLDQVAVSSGYYTGGAVTVNGDSNLVAENIKSGVSIFGVSGNYEGSGGDTSVEDSLITRTVTNYTNNRITYIDKYAFYKHSNLVSVNFPKVKTIDAYAFVNCSNLISISFPMVTTISAYAFQDCIGLTSVSFPMASRMSKYAFQGCDSLISINFPEISYIVYGAFSGCKSLYYTSFPMVKEIGSSAFFYCTSLTSLNFPMASRIFSNAFYYCTNLTSIYLTSSSVCSLMHSGAFANAGITSTTGSIFVPASLVASYKAATNWTYFANRIFSAP